MNNTSSGVWKDYYAILQVSQNATRQVIEAAYRSLVKEHHPDRGSVDGKYIRDINEAHESLCDEVRRDEYDQTCALTADQISAEPLIDREGEFQAPTPQPSVWGMLGKLALEIGVVYLESRAGNISGNWTANNGFHHSIQQEGNRLEIHSTSSRGSQFSGLGHALGRKVAFMMSSRKGKKLATLDLTLCDDGRLIGTFLSNADNVSVPVEMWKT
ncbi:MAG: J domain-containing protein [Verrucomicrobiales bacterium]|nr:J domain-containing protein [Verrucomicrobiales bacterium]